jgi:hypothetical protein
MRAAMTLLHDVIRDLQHGMRLLRRRPGFTAVVLTILSVAIGASVTVFSIVDAWLLRPLRFPMPDRLVIGLATQRDRPDEPAVFLFYRSYLGFKAESQSLASVSAAFRRSYLVTAVRRLVGRGHGRVGGVFRHHGVARSSGGHSVQGTWAVRRRRCSVMDSGTAVRGARDVIGTTVRLNGEPHEIVGVMPNGFDVRMLEQPRGAQLWTLIAAGERGYDATGMGPVALFARLRRDTTLASAQAELNSASAAHRSPLPGTARGSRNSRCC